MDFRVRLTSFEFKFHPLYVYLLYLYGPQFSYLWNGNGSSKVVHFHRVIESVP